MNAIGYNTETTQKIISIFNDDLKNYMQLTLEDSQTRSKWKQLSE